MLFFFFLIGHGECIANLSYFMLNPVDLLVIDSVDVRGIPVVSIKACS